MSKLQMTNGSLRSSDQETATTLNSYFTSVFEPKIDKPLQHFTFPSKQLINLINTHIKYTLSVPASRTKAVEYDRLIKGFPVRSYNAPLNDTDITEDHMENAINVLKK